MQRKLVSVLLLLLAFGGEGRTQDWQNPDRVINLFEGAVRSMRSFDVSATATMRVLFETEFKNETFRDEKGLIKTVPPKPRKLLPGEQPKVRTEFSRQVFQNGKGRVEILDGPGGKPIQIVSYDNDVGKLRVVHPSEATISRSIRSVSMDGGDYRDTHRSAFGGVSFEDLVRCLRERKGHVVVKAPSPNAPLLILEAEPLPKSRSGDIHYAVYGIRVGLDPSRSMMPALIEITQLVNGKLEVYRRMTVNEWKNINGVWAPVKATCQTFCMGKVREEIGDLATETVLTVDVARSSWNREVSEESLRLPLPAGTKVSDLERGVRYVTGQADPGKNLEDLAKHARDEIPVIVNPPPPKKNWATWLIFVMVGGAAVVVLGIAGVFVKKRYLGQSP